MKTSTFNIVNFAPHPFCLNQWHQKDATDNNIKVENGSWPPTGKGTTNQTTSSTNQAHTSSNIPYDATMRRDATKEDEPRQRQASTSIFKRKVQNAERTAEQQTTCSRNLHQKKKKKKRQWRRTVSSGALVADAAKTSQK